LSNLCVTIAYVNNPNLSASNQLASLSRRFWAFVFDLLVVVLGSLVLELILGGFSGLTNPIFSVEKFSLSPVIYVVNVIAIGLYFTLMVAKNAGQTLGASAMRVRIVNPSGASIGVSQAFVRFLVLVVSVGVICLGVIPAIFDSRKRTLADRLAGTEVVSAPRGPDW
jgi:uncharacterized RDD family membrane protein YckC